MTEDDEGTGKGGGKVAVEGTDADDDSEDKQPLVTVDDMGVGDYDCERAGVAVEAEAEDDAAEEVERVLIVRGAGPITCSSKRGHK